MHKLKNKYLSSSSWLLQLSPQQRLLITIMYGPVQKLFDTSCFFHSLSGSLLVLLLKFMVPFIEINVEDDKAASSEASH